MISKFHSRTRISGAALAMALLWAPTAFAQTAPSGDSTGQGNTAQTPATDDGEIVVQGFRASLNTALNLKRQETAAVDSIVAEDIGKFPDSNLAESMQRIPGIALARGDGGEGRNISVRGLGAQFTRVRINGMEGTSQSGGSDIQGPSNSGRSFDFNVFSTEIFSALSVRKTTSADVEEGSLGATVDLTAPHPMNYKKDFVVSATGRGIYNSVSKKIDPRASLLVSKKLSDSWGVLASVAYQKRHIREAGYAAVEHVGADTYAGPAQPVPGSNPPATIRFPFCTPLGGFTYQGVTYQSPLANAAAGGGPVGADANNCSTGNPRQSTQAAYGAIVNLRRSSAPNTPGSGAFFPRMPRYVNSEQDTKRIGGTFTVQFKPDNDTDISLDLLYSKFEVERRDNYLAAFSFARDITENGSPLVSVKEVQFTPQGSLLYGVFSGVNVRSEGLRDRFTSEYKQGNLNFQHKFNDVLEITGLFGMNQSLFYGTERFQTVIDAPNRNFTFDQRDGGAPKLIFDFDTANPANFQYGPRVAGGPVTGFFNLGGRPGSKNTTDNFTGEFNTIWSAAEGVKFKAGGQYRESDFKQKGVGIYTADTATRALPAGTTLASITRQITGVDEIWGNGAPASWTAVNADAFKTAFNTAATRYCEIPACGGGNARVREEVKGAYAMATFDTDGQFPINIRGDIGVRYVRTDMLASGYISVGLASSPTGTTGQYAVVRRGYDDWLPSANVVFDLTPDLLLRIAASKVMARPELGALTPTSGVTPTTLTGSVNNPFLDPYRANTFDAALEWYFRPGSLLSVAYFKKDIKTYIQRISSPIPFNQLGLPDALLLNSAATPTSVFTVSRVENTPGGPLEGVEVNAQVQLNFLPGFLSHFGVLANYTHVKANINYCLSSLGGVCTSSTTDALAGLSPNTASGTLFYEDNVFSIRSTGTFRDRFIRQVPGGFIGTDVQGNSPNFFVDASASLKLTDNVKLIVEGQNLTKEKNTLYNDSIRKDMLFQLNFGRTVTAGVNFQF